MAEPDNLLLAEFNARRSEEAFAALVRMHVNLVFATALRQAGDRGIAEEVTQNVFIELAQSAGKLGQHPTIAGWLYRTTLNKSRERLRSDLRRHHREQAAANLESTKAEGESVWAALVPMLDEALLALREPDRLAVIMHFMEGQTFREVGSALGVGEDAARKRVNGCLDELAKFFRQRGFVAPAFATGASLFTLAAQAAPAGLAASATTAGLAAAKAAGTATITLYTLMASTKIKIAAGLVVLASVGTTLVLEHQAQTSLREQNLLLQQQQAPMTEKIQQLQTERDEATLQLASLRDENERLNRDTGELLRLRGEVGWLRRAQDTAARSATLSSPSAATIPNEPSAAADLGRELGLAVVRGDPGALDKVAELSRAALKTFNPNRVKMDDTQRGEVAARALAPVQAAFEVIEEAAVKGDRVAIAAVERAVLIPELKGNAVQIVGTLAGQGSQAALEMLLNPDNYGILLSSTVSALRPAAEAGNLKAIDALAAVANDNKKQVLWVLVANGLATAAESGNAVAVNGLAAMTVATNQNVRNAIVAGLQRASANQNTKATETLRSMGVQTR